ncbi:hypothetical protein GH808_14580 [Acetobacterium fimetarium]|uniref:DUF3850 domain-containing protein n=1 Tax=Acetobacterium fimetarium TaxID=52691 RepID=A0ABR6WYX3_9FIRM|nr:hypothetical protein [Acetobacterium fimetarium]MBC3805633.1 hypothetical protein [Acetobacterium fimetarium]
MHNYTKIEPKDFKAYDCFLKPKSGNFKSILRRGEARKYTGISFENVEVVLGFEIEDKYGRDYYVEKAFLYSDQYGSEYDTFMREIEEFLLFDQVFLCDIIGLKGTAQVEVEEFGSKSKFKIIKFTPNGYDK